MEHPGGDGAVLRLAWNRLWTDLGRELHDAGFDDLRDAHRPLLGYPPIDGHRPSELATGTGLSKQAVNGLLRDLESFGYLTPDRDPADGRARIVRFTERGWACFDCGSRTSAAIGRRWAEQIGREAYDSFEGALRAIVDLEGDD